MIMLWEQSAGMLLAPIRAAEKAAAAEAGSPRSLRYIGELLT